MIYQPIFGVPLIIWINAIALSGAAMMVFNALINPVPNRSRLYIAVALWILFTGVFTSGVMKHLEHSTGFVPTSESLWLDTSLKSPQKPRVRINLARAYTVNGKITDALREYDNSLLLYAARPRDFESSFMPQLVAQNVGQILMHQGRPEAARDIMAKAWNRDPGFPGIAVNLSKIFAEGNQPYIALGLLDNAIMFEQQGKFPAFAYSVMGELHYNRGIILLNLSRCPEAMESFRMAYKVNRRFPVPRTECFNPQSNPNFGF